MIFSHSRTNELLRKKTKIGDDSRSPNFDCDWCREVAEPQSTEKPHQIAVFWCFSIIFRPIQFWQEIQGGKTNKHIKKIRSNSLYPIQLQICPRWSRNARKDKRRGGVRVVCASQGLFLTKYHFFKIYHGQGGYSMHPKSLKMELLHNPTTE